MSAVLVADRRVDGLASFTLEPGRNAVDMDLGKKMRWSVDGGAIGGGLSSDAPRLLGKGEGCRPGGAVGVPWGCHEAAADPRGCEPSPGRLSRRDARDRFDRAVPSLRRRRRRWGSAATVSPAGTTGRLSSGVIKGVSRVSGGCVGGTGLTSIDNASRRVATGRWLPPSSSNTKRRLPRRAALRRSLSPLGLETLSRIATSQEFRCLFMV